jgi:hypothetical protein
MEGSFMAQRTESNRSPNLSRWHHSETFSVFQPEGEPDDTFVDASQGTDKQFYERAFHLDIPQHWRKHKDGPHIHFLRQYQVDEFLDTLSYYHELLGFLPEDPVEDSFIFAVRETQAFRKIGKDPQVFLDVGE